MSLVRTGMCSLGARQVCGFIKLCPWVPACVALARQRGNAKNVTLQCLCPQGKSQLINAPLANAFKNSGWLTLTNNPVPSQTSAFVLILGMSEFTQEPLKRSISDSHNSLGPLDVSPIDFEIQTFFMPPLWCRFQGLGCPVSGINSSLFKERFWSMRSLPGLCWHV